MKYKEVVENARGKAQSAVIFYVVYVALKLIVVGILAPEIVMYAALGLLLLYGPSVALVYFRLRWAMVALGLISTADFWGVFLFAYLLDEPVQSTGAFPFILWGLSVKVLYDALVAQNEVASAKAAIVKRWSESEDRKDRQPERA